MEDTIIQNGWQKLASDTAYSYLYKSFKIKNLMSGLTYMNSIGSTVIASGLDGIVQFGMNHELFSVSINSPATAQLNDDHFNLASKIESIFLTE